MPGTEVNPVTEENRLQLAAASPWLNIICQGRRHPWCFSPHVTLFIQVTLFPEISNELCKCNIINTDGTNLDKTKGQEVASCPLFRLPVVGSLAPPVFISKYSGTSHLIRSV